MISLPDISGIWLSVMTEHGVAGKAVVGVWFVVNHSYGLLLHLLACKGNMLHAMSTFLCISITGEAKMSWD